MYRTYLRCPFIRLWSTQVLHSTYILPHLTCLISRHLIANDLILKRSTAIEHTVFADFGHATNKQYKDKMRSLYLNLKDKNNPGLRESVVSGSLAVSKFCRMSSQVGEDSLFTWSAIYVYLVLTHFFFFFFIATGYGIRGA